MVDFDYELPASAIAQTPAEPRPSARLLVALDPGGPARHATVAELPELVGPGDVIVVNETRVIPARLALRKATGGAAEVLLLERAEGAERGEWVALVKPGRRLAPGARLFGAGGLEVEIGDPVGRGDPAGPAGTASDREAASNGDGRRRVRLVPPPGTTEDDAIAAAGQVPLPPYIGTPLADPERYQTVYATTPGSVAAPTAGLHLTTDLLDACRSRGASVATVDLVVGLDTFRPITASRWADHVIHSERYAVPAATMAACRDASRVIAVGTTTVRALESAARHELAGRTDLFITPGFEFRVVDALLTNFHLPRSSLLLLLAAFVGDGWRARYDEALAHGYRFLSFGDAMLVGRA